MQTGISDSNSADEYTSKLYAWQIAKSLGKRFNYFDDPLKDDEVYERYCEKLENEKEIDFSHILICSYQLLVNNPFIAQNIAKIIRFVLVDEFQDTVELQYKILGEIVKANRAIKTLFVGDVNQAIYGNLGGVAKAKEEIEALMNITLKRAVLPGCYRSSQRIIDFYSNFEVEKTGVYSVAEEIKDIRGKICFNAAVSINELSQEVTTIIKSQLDAGVQEKDICVIAPQWSLLYSLSNKLQEMLPDIQFDAPDLSPFKYDPLNPFFLIAKLIYSPNGSKPRLRKKLAAETLSILREEYRAGVSERIDKHHLLRLINAFPGNELDGIAYYKACVEYVLAGLGLSFITEPGLKKTFDNFIEKTEDRIKRFSIEDSNAGIAKCFSEKSGIVISTIHGVKGEEYRTVIAVSLLNGYLPHWNTIIEGGPNRTSEANKLLYVLSSRAKENLFLFSERGHLTKKRKSYLPTDELSHVRFEYDPN